jgi:hypothetical protein
MAIQKPFRIFKGDNNNPLGFFNGDNNNPLAINRKDRRSTHSDEKTNMTRK